MAKTSSPNAELRRKISKLSTTSLLSKYQAGQFSDEEKALAEEFLTKRGVQFASPKADESQEVEPQPEPVVEQPTPEVAEEQQPTPTKAKKKTGSKKVKKLFTDETGKELTKSMLMRRLIRTNNDIKPKELNEKLIEAGFTKAYHSEIQRCRKQYGIVPGKK